MKILRAIDLCSGAGGWACAARGLPIQIVLAVDFWDRACKTYELNHPQTRVLCRDLRDASVQEEIIRIAREYGVDLIVGGIPCEWLSAYRHLNKVKAAELEEQRKTLDCCLGIVKWINPRFWCLEDVKALVKELPPLTPWQEINARHYSAQRRKRVFVGSFPSPTPPPDAGLVLRDRLRPGPYRVGARLFGRTPQLSRTFSQTSTLAAMPDRKAPTVCSDCSRRDAEMGIVDAKLPGGLRNMEWQERASLQGFPDDYLFYGSPTDVATQVGRAIQIDTGRAILSAIVAQANKEGAAA